MGKSSPLSAHISDLLEGLGSTPRVVASTLAEQGATGLPNDATSCVLARYLNAVLQADPDVKWVGVMQRYVHVRMSTIFPRRMLLLLPRALIEFVQAFDAMQFPELVDVPSTCRPDGHDALSASTPPCRLPDEARRSPPPCPARPAAPGAAPEPFTRGET